MSQYPAPEEYERERRRLDALRPWHRLGWVAVGASVVIALYLALKDLAGW